MTAIGTVVAAMVTAGVIGGGNSSRSGDAGGSTNGGGTANRDDPVVTTTVPRSESAGGQPVVSVAPGVVPIGQRFIITGSGFRPYEWVQVQQGGMFVAGDQADAQGNFRWTSTPIDQSHCASSPATMEVVRGEAWEVDIVDTISVRFCG